MSISAGGIIIRKVSPELKDISSGILTDNYILSDNILQKRTVIHGGNRCLQYVFSVLTCSSFSLRGRSCDLLAISCKPFNCPSETLTESLPALSPPSATSRQLLSAEAASGAKSETNESSGSRCGDPVADVCREAAKSGKGLRITPALALLGIHWAKKSSWLY